MIVENVRCHSNGIPTLAYACQSITGGQFWQILPYEDKDCRKCPRKNEVEKHPAFDVTAGSVHTADSAHMTFILTRKLKFSLQRDAPNWRLETQVKSALSQLTIGLRPEDLIIQRIS